MRVRVSLGCAGEGRLGPEVRVQVCERGAGGGGSSTHVHDGTGLSRGCRPRRATCTYRSRAWADHRGRYRVPQASRGRVSPACCLLRGARIATRVAGRSRTCGKLTASPSARPISRLSEVESSLACSGESWESIARLRARKYRAQSGSRTALLKWLGVGFASAALALPRAHVARCLGVIRVVRSARVELKAVDITCREGEGGRWE